MAKVVRPSSDTVQVMEDLIEELVQKADDRTFVLEGTPSTSVKYADGSYKTKPLVAGWEYFLTGGYVGTKGEAIFSFTPEDKQEYETIEFYITKLDQFMPLMGPFIGESLGVEGEKAAIVFQKAVDKKLLELSVDKERAETKLSANPNFGRFA